MDGGHPFLKPAFDASVATSFPTEHFPLEVIAREVKRQLLNLDQLWKDRLILPEETPIAPYPLRTLTPESVSWTLVPPTPTTPPQSVHVQNAGPPPPPPLPTPFQRRSSPTPPQSPVRITPPPFGREVPPNTPMDHLSPGFLYDADRIWSPPPDGMEWHSVGDMSRWPDPAEVEQNILSLLNPASPGVSYSALISSIGNYDRKAVAKRKRNRLYGEELPFAIGLPSPPSSRRASASVASAISQRSTASGSGIVAATSNIHPAIIKTEPHADESPVRSVRKKIKLFSAPTTDMLMDEILGFATSSSADELSPAEASTSSEDQDTPSLVRGWKGKGVQRPLKRVEHPEEYLQGSDELVEGLDIKAEPGLDVTDSYALANLGREEKFITEDGREALLIDLTDD
ncbi:hypothetical protein BD310DRAFT_975144 [Dichomitus squalens]|uniref:Uncharacterized protein n=1 Tax=Dichomitus squalens TaxID=114155 RepID=A0A4Q9Q316_9APHY|nr:hypothetical protein BD310DRAFT_975144 [Dichomitus squalens]